MKCANCAAEAPEYKIRVRDYRQHLSGRRAPWRTDRRGHCKPCAEELAAVLSRITPAYDYDAVPVDKQKKPAKRPPLKLEAQHSATATTCRCSTCAASR